MTIQKQMLEKLVYAPLSSERQTSEPKHLNRKAPHMTRRATDNKTAPATGSRERSHQTLAV